MTDIDNFHAQFAGRINQTTQGRIVKPSRTKRPRSAELKRVLGEQLKNFNRDFFVKRANPPAKDTTPHSSSQTSSSLLRKKAKEASLLLRYEGLPPDQKNYYMSLVIQKDIELKRKRAKKLEALPISGKRKKRKIEKLHRVAKEEEQELAELLKTFDIDTIKRANSPKSKQKDKKTILKTTDSTSKESSSLIGKKSSTPDFQALVTALCGKDPVKSTGAEQELLRRFTQSTGSLDSAKKIVSNAKAMHAIGIATGNIPIPLITDSSQTVSIDLAKKEITIAQPAEDLGLPPPHILQKLLSWEPDADKASIEWFEQQGYNAQEASNRLENAKNLFRAGTSSPDSLFLSPQTRSHLANMQVVTPKATDADTQYRVGRAWTKSKLADPFNKKASTEAAQQYKDTISALVPTDSNIPYFSFPGRTTRYPATAATYQEARAHHHPYSPVQSRSSSPKPLEGVTFPVNPSSAAPSNSERALLISESISTSFPLPSDSGNTQTLTINSLRTNAIKAEVLRPPADLVDLLRTNKPQAIKQIGGWYRTMGLNRKEAKQHTTKFLQQEKESKRAKKPQNTFQQAPVIATQDTPWDQVRQKAGHLHTRIRQAMSQGAPTEELQRRYFDEIKPIIDPLNLPADVTHIEKQPHHRTKFPIKPFGFKTTKHEEYTPISTPRSASPVPSKNSSLLSAENPLIPAKLKRKPEDLLPQEQPEFARYLSLRSDYTAAMHGQSTSGRTIDDIGQELKPLSEKFKNVELPKN